MKVLNVTKLLDRLASACRLTAMCAVAGLMLAGMSACDGKDEPIPAPDEPQDKEEHTYITMIVRSSGTESRAEEGPTWGDNYNSKEGNYFENYIDPQRIHVAVYDAAGKTIADLYSGQNENKVMVQTISEKEGLHYVYFDISGLGLEDGKEYMVSVIANYEGRPTGLLLNDGTFSLSKLSGPNPVVGPNYYNGAIPMFGFLRWTFGEFSFPNGYDGFPSIGEIRLLRSVCKIEVSLTKDYNRYPNAEFMRFDEGLLPSLGFVSGRHINQTGRFTPNSTVWKTKTKTTDLTFLESYYEYKDRWTSTTDSEHLTFPAYSEDGRTAYIYLPEASGASMYPNPDALRLYVSIIFDDPDPTLPEDSPKKHRKVTGTLFPSIEYNPESMLPYEDTDYNSWRLVRNHIYRFIVTDFIDETTLDYKVAQTQDKVITVPDFN